MTSFQFVFGLVTIITSLALTRLMTGLVGVLRNAERVQFSAPHALWAWAAFLFTIGNWASFWDLRSLTSWPAWAVLLSVATLIAQYVLCAFVTPDTPPEGKIDLVDFHQREHRRYILAAITQFTLALGLNFAFGGGNFYADWWRDSVLSLIGLALALLAFVIKARWAQVFSAAAFAALTTYYTIITCNFVAA